jgi:hypothetical protein
MVINGAQYGAIKLVMSSNIRGINMYRQKKYECGNYMDIEIFGISQKVKRFKRAKKVKESTPAQKNLNDKNSFKYFVRKANLNFNENDFTGDLTFENGYLPNDHDDALRLFQNFIERVSYHNKKAGSPRPEYMYVISDVDKDGNQARLHIHLFIKNVKWSVLKDRWGMGYVNTEPIQLNEYGLTGKALYFARQGKGKKIWGCSKGLKNPEPEISDKAITRTDAEKITRNPEDREYFEKKYKGWTFTDCRVEEDLINGRRFYIRMRKHEPAWKIKKDKRDHINNKPATRCICDTRKGT